MSDNAKEQAVARVRLWCVLCGKPEPAEGNCACGSVTFTRTPPEAEASEQAEARRVERAARAGVDADLGAGTFDALNAESRAHWLKVYRAALAAGGEGESWKPTPDAINALPDGIRQYVHDLETRCDPAGDVAALTLTRDQNAMLVQQLAERERKVAELEARKSEWEVLSILAKGDIAAAMQRAEKAEARVAALEEWRTEMQEAWRMKGEAFDLAIKERDQARAVLGGVRNRLYIIAIEAFRGDLMRIVEEIDKALGEGDGELGNG